MFHTEAQSVGLVWIVIWILTENHHFDLETETELKLKTRDNHFQILQMTRVKERQHTKLYVTYQEEELPAGPDKNTKLTHDSLMLLGMYLSVFISLFLGIHMLLISHLFIGKKVALRYRTHSDIYSFIQFKIF